MGMSGSDPPMTVVGAEPLDAGAVRRSSTALGIAEELHSSSV